MSTGQNNNRSRQMSILFTCLIAIFFTSVCFGQESLITVGMDYQIPSQESSSLVSLLSVNSFVDWQRYPAEERNWLVMQNATAYFRDVLVGARTLINNPTDGENWTADSTLPDGLTLTSDPIRFYSSYNNQQNCFVSPYWTICNANSLLVRWYTIGQCKQPGTWTMNFYNNGNNFYTGQFTLLPQIPPNKVPSGPVYNQGSYNDPNNTLHIYDSICRTTTCTTRSCDYPCDGREGEVKVTIAKEGCYLTDAAMILSYHGVSVDPPTLNTWLINFKDKNGRPLGYSPQGEVMPYAVPVYARQRGVNMRFGPPAPQSVWSGLEELERYVCYYGPQMIGVNLNAKGRPGHWVTATGRNQERTTYSINDPNGGVEILLNQRYPAWRQMRTFGGPEYTYTDMTGILIRFYSPGELLLTDPQGRRVGYDPITDIIYDEIFDSYYDSYYREDAETGDPGPEIKELFVPAPIAGHYQLRITGTDIGTYTLDIIGSDPELNLSRELLENIPIAQGEIHNFNFYFAKTVGAEVEVSGGFDGGGQRPRDVNKFLTYSNPTEGRTSLPVGTIAYPLIIFYHKDTIPASFTAELNGVDISSFFSPTPGSNQVINLNLQSGSNVLVLSVDGNLPNRVATDTDRLVFLVW